MRALESSPRAWSGGARWTKILASAESRLSTVATVCCVPAAPSALEQSPEIEVAPFSSASGLKLRPCGCRQRAEERSCRREARTSLRPVRN
jgi:hypothetical protein